MRENSGRPGRVSNKLKAALVALFAAFAFSAVSATAANANDGTLKLSFTEGQIAVLPEILGPIAADPPAGNPVTVEGALAQNGAFSAPQSGFSFPTQTIDLPDDDPIIASLLGPTVDIILNATAPFTGNFDRTSGAFSAAIPLALTLQFNPPATDLACRLPFTLGVNTTSTLVFPGAGEGGSDLTFPAAPFAAPSRNGAAYGSWPAVPFAAIEDAPPMDPDGNACAQLLSLLPTFIPEWPPGLDGLDGQIWLNGQATVTDPPVDPPVCPDGQTGTPPNCETVTPPPPPARCQVARVALTRAAVRAGQRARIRVTVRNNGRAACRGRVTLRSNRGTVRVPKAVAINVAPGRAVNRVITVSTTRRARGRATITARFGGKVGRSVVTVRPAARKRR